MILRKSILHKYALLKSVTRLFSSSSSGSFSLSMNTYNGTDNSPIDKPLLITHGLLGSKQNWNSLAKNLTSKFKKVVTIDLRNHGESPHSDEMCTESMADDIKHLIINNDYHDSILVGHSLGGLVAMYLALKESELLSALVVVDISPAPSKRILNFTSYIDAMKSAPIDQDISLPLNRKIIDSHLENHIKDQGVRNFLLTNLVRDATSNQIKWRVNLQSIGNNIHQFINFPKLERENFKKPTLFIGGKQSDHIRQEHWSFIKELFPLASLKIIEGAGHWVHADKPLEFVNTLVEFGSSCRNS